MVERMSSFFSTPTLQYSMIVTHSTLGYLESAVLELAEY
jgi:hypothetical protein